MADYKRLYLKMAGSRTFKAVSWESDGVYYAEKLIYATLFDDSNIEKLKSVLKEKALKGHWQIRAISGKVIWEINNK